MIQYNSLNVKLSNWQLDKFKSAIKNETEVALRLSSSMVGDNETNFSHKLLLTNRQVANIPKVFPNNSSVNIKLSKANYQRWYNQDDLLVDYLVHYSKQDYH